jgi:hypothetical protein
VPNDIPDPLYYLCNVERAPARLARRYADHHSAAPDGVDGCDTHATEAAA